MPRKKPPENDGPPLMPPAGDWSAIKAELQERLEQGRADRVETQAKIVRDDLLPRDGVALALGNIFAVYRNRVLVLDESAGDIIAALIGIPDKQAHKVRKTMGEPLYDMVRKIKKGLEKFVQARGA